MRGERGKTPKTSAHYPLVVSASLMGRRSFSGGRGLGCRAVFCKKIPVKIGQKTGIKLVIKSAWNI
jgi:hypothetical protein